MGHYPHWVLPSIRSIGLLDAHRVILQEMTYKGGRKRGEVSCMYGIANWLGWEGKLHRITAADLLSLAAMHVCRALMERTRREAATARNCGTVVSWPGQSGMLSGYCVLRLSGGLSIPLCQHNIVQQHRSKLADATLQQNSPCREASPLAGAACQG